MSKQGERGPDKKPRIRRTKAEILAARGIQPKPKPEIENETTHKMETKTNNIELIPLDIEVKPVTENVTQLDSTAIFEVTRRVTSQVLDTVYADLDKRSKQLLAQVEAKASARQVAIAIKINEEPIKKLEQAAHPQLARIVSLLKIGLLPMLVGPAGCGKTFAAHQAAEALGLTFAHICFTAGVSETWLFGRQTPTGFVEAEFVKTYRDGGVFLADELDAADPNVILALNTALANGHLYNPISGQTIKRHPNFNFIAATNTVGKGGDAQYTGRNRLDAATLDRMRIVRVGYDATVEDALCPNPTLAKRLRTLRDKLKQRGANEVISYRAFADGYKMHTALGDSIDAVVANIAESWADDVKADLGIKT